MTRTMSAHSATLPVQPPEPPTLLTMSVAVQIS
jgi:hypothetical protein